MKPSVEAAANMAKILEVSLDWLVGNADFKEVDNLPSDDKTASFCVIGEFPRDVKTKQAYAS